MRYVGCGAALLVQGRSTPAALRAVPVTLPGRPLGERRAVDLRTHVAAVGKRPGMYGLDGSFGQFTAYLNGMDAGTDGRALAGFREWLVMRFDDGDNLH